MCWLYFFPNLLVIQQLETLYLGGNNVRVVCERVWRIDQVCAIKSILATATHNWLTSGDSLESSTHVKHAESWRARTTRSLQDKKYSRRFYCLVTGTHDCPSREWLAKALCFAKKLLFTFLHIPYYKYHYTHEIYKASGENFER